jgi:hypothetical protein
MRRWAPLAAALSVIAVAVAVSLVFGRSSGGAPPTLRLASGSSGVGIAADAPLATDGTSTNASFELVGPLPTGPAEARAHPLPGSAATEADVRRLAAALGVSDDPRRVEHAWQAGSLRVEDAAGNPWSMSAGCGPDVPVSSDGAASICASGTGTVGPGSVSSGSGSGGSVSSGPATTPNSTDVAPPPPAPVISPCPDNARCAKPGWAPAPPTPGPGPDVAGVRRTARAVLDKLGLSDADVAVQPTGEQAWVQADPRVDGLRTVGYSTQLQIDSELTVVGGYGFLGRPTEGASYPIVSAETAYKALPGLPRPMFLCPANAGCPQPAPVRVTGAQLGLSLTPLADDQAALLPTWLFTTDNWPTFLPQLAIEPRFLDLPKPVTIDPGIKPVPPEPGPNVDPGSARAAFSFDTVFPSDDPNVVIVQYGDSSSCPHTNVTPLVKESTDSIVVTLEGDTQSTKQVCTDDYRQQLVTLKLAAPLGDRKVIDGSRGEPVAIDRACARPMGQPAVPKGCKP